MRWLPACTLMLAMAGCLSTDGGPTIDLDPVDADDETGAIVGLLVDDRFRPIFLDGEGFILLQETGAQAQTTPNGEFSFTRLDPGTYTLRASAPGHEATPVTAQVAAGQVTDLNIVARRTNDAGGAIITEEYAVFIPCGVDVVADGFVEDCTLDQSGDSYRPGFTVDYTRYPDASHLVSEMRASRSDRYEVQVREDDGTGGGGARMAVAQFEGDYVRAQWGLGAINEQWNGQGNNEAWTNDFPLKTILFRDSPGREELQGLGSPTCCGAGAYVAIKAQFVQSLFLGEAGVAVDAYCVLC